MSRDITPEGYLQGRDPATGAALRQCGGRKGDTDKRVFPQSCPYSPIHYKAFPLPAAYCAATQGSLCTLCAAGQWRLPGCGPDLRSRWRRRPRGLASTHDDILVQNFARYPGSAAMTLEAIIIRADGAFAETEELRRQAFVKTLAKRASRGKSIASHLSDRANSGRSTPEWRISSTCT